MGIYEKASEPAQNAGFPGSTKVYLPLTSKRRAREQPKLWNVSKKAGEKGDG